MSEIKKTESVVETDVIENEEMDCKKETDNGKMCDDTEKKSKYKISQIMLIIRVLICGYILYIIKELVEGYIAGNGPSLPVLVAVSLIFGFCGIFLGIKSIMALVKGEFTGGKADI